MTIWQCKIGEVSSIPNAADMPMRQAVAEAYRQITGQDCDFIFSGWGAELTEQERAVFEDRLPDPSKCDLYGIPDPAAFVEAARGMAEAVQEYLPILTALERIGYWDTCAHGTGIATANRLRAKIAAFRQASGEAA